MGKKAKKNGQPKANVLISPNGEDSQKDRDTISSEASTLTAESSSSPLIEESQVQANIKDGFSEKGTRASSKSAENATENPATEGISDAPQQVEDQILADDKNDLRRKTIETAEPDSSTNQSSSELPRNGSTVLSAVENGDVEAHNKQLKALLVEAQTRAEAAEAERDEANENYDDLLEKVSAIKESLGTRLKADAASLQDCRAELSAAQAEIAKLRPLEAEVIKVRSEAASLKARNTELATELAGQQTLFKEASADSSSTIEALETRLAKTDDDLNAQRQAARHLQQLSEGLEAKLSEATTARQQSESDLQQEVDKQRLVAKDASQARDAIRQELVTLQAKYEETQAEMEKANSARSELEQEAREKTLLIGKLRHEAVILNDHLTNALRMVKKDAEGQTVDKELVSNLFVQFATVPRQDTKKFEILQLIANFLDWDEDRRAQVGLSRSGVHLPGLNNTAATGSNGERQGLGGVLGKFAEFLERESRKK